MICPTPQPMRSGAYRLLGVWRWLLCPSLLTDDVTYLLELLYTL